MDRADSRTPSVGHWNPIANLLQVGRTHTTTTLFSTERGYLGAPAYTTSSGHAKLDRHTQRGPTLKTRPLPHTQHLPRQLTRTTSRCPHNQALPAQQTPAHTTRSFPLYQALPKKWALASISKQYICTGPNNQQIDSQAPTITKVFIGPQQ